MNFSVANKLVTVVGAGRSGIAAAKLLVSKGARVTVADASGAIDHAEELSRLGVTLELGPHQPAQFRNAALLVLSPGVPPHQAAIDEARRAGVPVIGEVELASRWLAGRVIAITGTKGKSTTTTLTSQMLAEGGLSVTAGGNLGRALSHDVIDSRPDSIHVVEVSSFQLESTETFKPWIAVLLNVSADHLDRHASYEEYGAAKARIFANQTPSDWAVVNADDPGVLALAHRARARRFDFALDHAELRDGVTVEGSQIVRRDAGVATPLLPLSSVKLQGRHLLSDVLAATAVSCLAGVTPPAMQRAVERFRGLEHALEQVAEIDGVRFVNDSKATNIAAAKRALESFESDDRSLVVIMGGRFKGGRFEDLRDAVASHVRAIVAIGEAQPLIEHALSDLVQVVRAASMEDAVTRANREARPQGVVLLAPACASFDMFRDYAARGQAFKDAVRRLGEAR